VTHAHADHYLGIGALLERFPGARPLATAGVVEATLGVQAVGSAVLAPRELAAQGENLVERGGDQGMLTVGPLRLQVPHVGPIASEAT
jgi:glyoxylase-like metal-dependent hydrolase (beta-lactamase superfamily II)